MTDRVGHRSVRKLSFPSVATVRSSGSSESVRIKGTLNGKQRRFVLDSGANHSLVRSGLVSTLSLAEIPGGLLDVTGRRSTLYGPTMVSLEIEGVTLQQNVYVAPDMCDDVILGLDFLRQNRCILDLERERVRI